MYRRLPLRLAACQAPPTWPSITSSPDWGKCQPGQTRATGGPLLAGICGRLGEGDPVEDVGLARLDHLEPARTHRLHEDHRTGDDGRRAVWVEAREPSPALEGKLGQQRE